MNITSNIPDSDILTIGKVGFDRVILYGFKNREMFPEPIIENCSVLGSAFKDISDVYELENGSVLIKKDTYILKFGNHVSNLPSASGRIRSDIGFALLEISATKVYGNNIQNISVRRLKNVVFDAFEELKTDYRLTFLNDISTIRVKFAEINITFPINHSFEDYGRITTLMSYALTSVSRSSVAKRGSFESWNNGKKKLETDYLLKGKTLTVKAYNKTNEASDKPFANFKFDGDMFRFEISAKEQMLVDLSPVRYDDRHHLYLSDITDESLNNYFHTYCTNMFNRIQTHLDTQFCFKAPQTESFDYLKLLNLSLRYALRSSPTAFTEQIVRLIHDYEITNGVPMILDLVDLLKVFEASGIDELSREQIMISLKDIIANPSLYSTAFASLVKQRPLFDELKARLLHPSEFHLFVTNGMLRNGMNSLTDYRYVINPLRLHPHYNITEPQLLNLYQPFDDVIYRKNTTYEYTRLATKGECRYPIAIDLEFFHDIIGVECYCARRITESSVPSNIDIEYLNKDSDEYKAYLGHYIDSGDFWNSTVTNDETFINEHPGIEFKNK